MATPWDQIGLDFPQSYPNEGSFWSFRKKDEEKEKEANRKAALMLKVLLGDEERKSQTAGTGRGMTTDERRAEFGGPGYGGGRGDQMYAQHLDALDAIENQNKYGVAPYQQMAESKDVIGNTPGLAGRIESALSGGLRAKNPMLAAPMGPQSAAEVAPGQGAFVPGTTMSGRAGGAFVQAPLPGPGQAGLDRVAAAGGTGRQTGTYELSGKNRMVGTMTPEEVARKRAETAIAIKEMEQRMDARRGRAVSLPGTQDPQFDKLMNIISNRSSNQAKLAGKNPFATGGGGDDIVSRARAIVASGGGSISMDQAVGLVEAQDRRKDAAAEREFNKEITLAGVERDKTRFNMQTETERLQQDTLRAQRDSLSKAEEREQRKIFTDKASSIAQKRAAAKALGEPYEPTPLELEIEAATNLSPEGRKTLLDDAGMFDPDKALEAIQDHYSGKKTMKPNDLKAAEEYAASKGRTWSEYIGGEGQPETPASPRSSKNPFNPMSPDEQRFFGAGHPTRNDMISNWIRGIQSAAGR